MLRAPSRARSSRLRPTAGAALVAIALRSGILRMGGVSFLAPRGRSRSLQPEGYAAFFMPPVHNLRVYLHGHRAHGTHAATSAANAARTAAGVWWPWRSMSHSWVVAV